MRNLVFKKIHDYIIERLDNEYKNKINTHILPREISLNKCVIRVITNLTTISVIEYKFDHRRGKETMKLQYTACLESFELRIDFVSFHPKLKEHLDSFIEITNKRYKEKIGEQ